MILKFIWFDRTTSFNNLFLVFMQFYYVEGIAGPLCLPMEEQTWVKDSISVSWMEDPIPPTHLHFPVVSEATLIC